MHTCTYTLPLSITVNLQKEHFKPPPPKYYNAPFHTFGVRSLPQSLLLYIIKVRELWVGRTCFNGITRADEVRGILISSWLNLQILLLSAVTRPHLLYTSAFQRIFTLEKVRCQELLYPNTELDTLIQTQERDKRAIVRGNKCSLLRPTFAISLSLSLCSLPCKGLRQPKI